MTTHVITDPVEPTPFARLHAVLKATGEPVHPIGLQFGTGYYPVELRKSSTSDEDKAEGFVVLLGYYNEANYSIPRRKELARDALAAFMRQYLNREGDFVAWRMLDSGWPCVALTESMLQTLYAVTGAQPLQPLPTTTVGGYHEASRQGAAAMCELYLKLEAANTALMEEWLRACQTITRLDKFMGAMQPHIRAWQDVRLATHAEVVDLLDNGETK